MKPLFRIAEGAAAIQLQIAGLAVLAIFLTISLDVLMKAFFNAPFSITIELVSYYYMIPLTFLPMMMLELRQEHIDTNLFYQMFPTVVQRIAQVISGAITIGIYGLLTRFTFEQALKSTASGEVAMGVNLLPIWPMRWVLPITFAFATLTAVLMTLHLLMNGSDDD